MPPFRTEVDDFEETSRALRAIKIAIAEIDAGRVTSLDDLVDRPGGAAGTLGGRIAVEDRYGKWQVLPRKNDGDVLVVDDDAELRVSWSNRLSVAEAGLVTLNHSNTLLLNGIEPC